MVNVSNNPHRWLLPFWADLHEQPFFGHLAPELKADAFAAALDTDHPAKALEIREWNATTRRAMLAVLDEGVRAARSANKLELWADAEGRAGSALRRGLPPDRR